MTFQQLEYIVEISKCGSINKAAQKLFLSQSGISTAVRELESELGIALLARSNRGVEFTPEGKEFLSYAVSLLEQKRWIEGLYGEARNSAAPVRFLVSSQRYPFVADAFLRLLQVSDENRFRLGLRETGMDGVIDELRTTRGALCAAFLYQTQNRQYKVSLRSNCEEVDVSRIAQSFGGGGHRKAAGCFMSPALEQDIRLLMEELQKQLPGTQET